MIITLIGDIAFTGLLSDEPEKNAERFKEVSKILSGSDLVFANLEVPVGAGKSVNQHKKLIHSSLPEPTENLLKLLNISCVSLANNHIYDYTMPGLESTIGLLDKLGINFTGAGWLDKHTEPVIIETEKKKIAFVAYVDATTNPGVANYPDLKINDFNFEKVFQDISSLRSQADQIICSIHWGVDYSFYPSLSQREIARKLIDAGADVIMGHHPHTIQPFEKYGHGIIFYSLGGLSFGDFIKPGKTNLQALYRKTKKGLIVNWSPFENRFEFISTKEKKGNTIILTGMNYTSWSNKKWKLFRIRHSSVIMDKLFRFKEKVADRISEYFFGYYSKPFINLFRISNFSKFLRLFRKS